MTFFLAILRGLWGLSSLTRDWTCWGRGFLTTGLLGIPNDFPLLVDCGQVGEKVWVRMILPHFSPRGSPLVRQARFCWNHSTDNHKSLWLMTEPYFSSGPHVHSNPVAVVCHAFSSRGPLLLDKALSRTLMVIMIARERKARKPVLALKTYLEVTCGTYAHISWATSHMVTSVNDRFPWWLRGKKYACQCRRRGFDLPAETIPWRSKW